MIDKNDDLIKSNKPVYADFSAPAKFSAILSIIAKHLYRHPRAICSYSGGSDSDIMIDLIERARKTFPELKPVKYVFFNTGLEMQATKDHIKETSEKYGVEIETIRPKINIVLASRKYGIPFMSKIISECLSDWQKKNIPLTIVDEFNKTEDKISKRQELRERFPKCEQTINFLCSCDSSGTPRPKSQLSLNHEKYLFDFISMSPPDFKISAKCCYWCKKRPAYLIQKDYDMIITGERRDEGGVRSISYKGIGTTCFYETSAGQFRFRPLYFVSDKDKEWYKNHYGIRYSDAYEVYNLKRTGCCGCPISYRAVTDLELVKPFEPYLVKAAWDVFGKSYEYRLKYNEYKAVRKSSDKKARRGGGSRIPRDLHE